MVDHFVEFSGSRRKHANASHPEPQQKEVLIDFKEFLDLDSLFEKKFAFWRFEMDCCFLQIAKSWIIDYPILIASSFP